MRLLPAALLALGCSAAGAAQQPPVAASTQLDPERLAIANEIIDLSFPPPTRHAMMMRTADAMMAQARQAAMAAAGAQLDAGASQILERHFERVHTQTAELIAQRSPPIFTAVARAYARRFSRDELVQIRAFVATPTGAKYVQQSADIFSDPDVAQANTVYLTSVMQAMGPLQVQLMEELRTYLRTRQERPSDTSGSTIPTSAG